MAVKEQDMLVALENTQAIAIASFLAMPPVDVREVGNGCSRMTWDEEEEEEGDIQPVLS